MTAWRSLPPDTLLARYDGPDGYVDCLETLVPWPVELGELIAAFYNSRAFRPERWLLGALLGMKAGQADVARLAAGEIQRFSAWTVEDRTARQILLCDFQQRTRTWLMVEPAAGGTMLRFGTAVVPRSGWLDRAVFNTLKGFHRFYARRLFASAAKDLISGRKPGC